MGRSVVLRDKAQGLLHWEVQLVELDFGNLVLDVGIEWLFEYSSPQCEAQKG